MDRFSPRTTLLILLAVAIAIFGGGASLARKVEFVRVERNHRPLAAFAGAVQNELKRLDLSYERRLRQLARDVELRRSDLSALQKQCDLVVGIVQACRLHRAAGAETDLRLDVMASAERAPLLTFHPQNDAFPGPQFVIPTSEVFGQDNDHGWIDEPGSPLLFWLRKNSETAVVFLIDRAEVAAAIDRWIIAWSEQPFSAVRNDGGADRLLGSREQALASVGETNSAHPDLVLSLEDRFGAWQLASWDRLDRRVHYSLPILAASAILALSVGLLAMLVSLQQRRALALAAQRVSFVNRVSHELRSPLTNILLNVDLAAEDIEDLSADGLGRLELVQEEARRLGRLIDNVLSFSRSEQARLRIEPRLCSPSIVLEAVLAQFRPAFRRRGLEIRSSADALPPCLLDGDALAQILANLLSNAEKYVRNGGVEVTCTHREDQLLVVVSDTGPGIPAGESERIFQPFERLDIQVTEGVSGTGLGLAISRDLAGRMGGSLRLLPSVRGAAFELRIPAPLADPLRSISAA